MEENARLVGEGIRLAAALAVSLSRSRLLQWYFLGIIDVARKRDCVVRPVILSGSVVTTEVTSRFVIELITYLFLCAFMVVATVPTTTAPNATTTYF